MKHLSRLSFTVALAVCLGCAATSISTYRDPGTLRRRPATSAVVFGLVGGLSDRQLFESTIAQRLSATTGASTVPSINLLPPTRVYDPDQVLEVLRQNGIESALFLILTDAYADQVQLPSTSTTTGAITTTAFGSFYSSTYNSRTVTYPGAVVNKPRLTFEIRFFDLRYGDIAWISSALTEGNAFADGQTMASSVGRRISEQLLRENLLSSSRPRTAPTIRGTSLTVRDRTIAGSAAIALQDTTGDDHSIGNPVDASLSSEHALAVRSVERVLGAFTIELSACPKFGAKVSLVEVDGEQITPIALKGDNPTAMDGCQKAAFSLPLRLFVPYANTGQVAIVLETESDGVVLEKELTIDPGF